MNGAPFHKKDWIITAESLDKLLDFLDPDRAAAGLKYEKIRARLTRLFHWRGCSTPEEYVDRVIDRVARRLLEGADLTATIANPYLYFHGVALNVLREHWRDPGRDSTTIDLPSPAKTAALQSSFHDPIEARELELERELTAQRLQCLRECLQALPPEHLELITRYHDPGTRLNKDVRKDMATSLGIPLNALRIRAYRVRSGLMSCVSRCAERMK
jgi:DNA-directed RNA polymerase specialized sigma24 family protein